MLEDFYKIKDEYYGGFLISRFSEILIKEEFNELENYNFLIEKSILFNWIYIKLEYNELILIWIYKY